jgi:hypothetical protein
MRTRSALLVLVCSAIWLCALGAGLMLVSRYGNTPGHAGHSPAEWPSASGLQLATDHPTLVMLAHPHCPCTRAAIGELALLMARCKGRVDANVLFLKPPDTPVGWELTDLWKSAASIPGVRVSSDEGGVEAANFHASTSSQVVLYDVDGRLLFSGGITVSRGHSGDNAGRSAILSLLTERKLEVTETFVFGCPLVEGSSECYLGKGGSSHVSGN